jgi:hypothetical protein
MADASFRATEAGLICVAVASLARRCRSEILPSILGRSIRLRMECIAARAGNLSAAAEKVGYDPGKTGTLKS